MKNEENKEKGKNMSKKRREDMIRIVKGGIEKKDAKDRKKKKR